MTDPSAPAWNRLLAQNAADGLRITVCQHDLDFLVSEGIDPTYIDVYERVE